MNTILTLLHSESSKLYAILAFLSAIGLSSIFTSGKATSENTTFGIHERNKNGTYKEKVKFSVSFMH